MMVVDPLPDEPLLPNKPFPNNIGSRNNRNNNGNTVRNKS
jgi:hypothetical protein